MADHTLEKALALVNAMQAAARASDDIQSGDALWVAIRDVSIRDKARVWDCLMREAASPVSVPWRNPASGVDAKEDKP